MVIGNGIYSPESPICKSAIHAGVIDEHGGLVMVAISWPHDFFYGVEARNILSLDSNWTPKSYTLARPIPF